MKTKSRENLVASIVIVIMVALLVGLTQWRWSETQAHAQWVDLVSSVPSVTHRAEKTVKDAKAVVQDATQSGVETPSVEILRIEITETEVLSDQYSQLLEYTVVRPKADSGVPSVLDPFEVDSEDDTELEVTVPTSYRRETESYKKVRERLDVAVDHLDEGITELKDEIAEVKVAATGRWTSTRQELEAAMASVSDLVLLDETNVTDPEALQKLLTSVADAQKLLDANATVPVNVKAINDQSTKFQDAIETLKRDGEAVAQSAAERELALQLAAEEEAARYQAELEAAEFAAQQQAPQLAVPEPLPEISTDPTTETDSATETAPPTGEGDTTPDGTN